MGEGDKVGRELDLCRLTVEVEAGDRALALSVHVGRSVDNPSPCRTWVIVECACRAPKIADGPAWTEDQTIVIPSDSLVRHSAALIEHPKAQFIIRSGRATLDTMWTTRGIWDFIGLAEYLEVVGKIDVRRA